MAAGGCFLTAPGERSSRHSRESSRGSFERRITATAAAVDNANGNVLLCTSAASVR